ncbi:hypothetical protein [Dokdonia sp.]|uniref:hypothetical protein n=1 Tax=Dokdonia sp. TaxID=2024995 RepID=UPI003266A9E9
MLHIITVLSITLCLSFIFDSHNEWLPKDENNLKNTPPNTIPIVINNNPEVDDLKKSVNLLTNTVFWFAPSYCLEKNNRFIIPALKEEISDMVNYIDFFDGREDYFFNCDYINKEGVVLFTEHIVNDPLLNK